jgi:hypothetical protein
MAYTSGTASNYVDLLARLESFLTTNPSLIAAGQAWTTLRYAYGVTPSTFTGRIAFSSSTNGTNFLDAPPSVLPATYYRARILGEITVPETGNYVFGVDGDDCIDLLIDGNLAAGWYGSHAQEGGFSHNETIALTAGVHTFAVRFTQGTGGRAASIGWRKPGDASITVIPAASLSNMTLSWSEYVSAAPTTTGGMDSLFNQKQLLMKAPGLSGTEEIFVGIVPYESVTSDYYNWAIMASLGHNASADYGGQPYKSGDMRIYLWNDPIPYWFVANGNRVIMIARVDSTYQIMYLGKFLPYMLPNQYPYPVLVCGTHNSAGSRYSSVNYDFSSILHPGAGCQMYYVDGTWKTVKNRYEQSGYSQWTEGVNVWPTAQLSGSMNILDGALSWPDGGYTLLPLILEMNTPVSNVLGEVDGIMWVSGHQNASENIINVGGQDYLVVQDVWKQNRRDYMAVRLA